MKRELSWLEPRTMQAGYSDDRLYAGAASGLAPDPEPHCGPLDHTYLLEQADEERRISIAGAFIMFMFGFGCGVFWTVLLTWLF